MREYRARASGVAVVPCIYDFSTFLSLSLGAPPSPHSDIARTGRLTNDVSRGRRRTPLCEVERIPSVLFDEATLRKFSRNREHGPDQSVSFGVRIYILRHRVPVNVPSFRNIYKFREQWPDCTKKETHKRHNGERPRTKNAIGATATATTTTTAMVVVVKLSQRVVENNKRKKCRADVG